MGAGYTELFFFDEATAMAAGHRPCFECRRAEAMAFAEAWARGRARTGLGAVHARPRAAEIDAVLHAERIDRTKASGRGKRVTPVRLEDLPPGAMAAFWGYSWLVTDDHLLQWSFDGYVRALRRFDGPAELLTPPSMVAALRAGYRPQVASDLF